MLCIAGLQGYFKRLNPAWERTLPFPQPRSSAAIRFWISSIQTTVMLQMPRSGNSRKATVTTSFENRYRCSDGSYKWLLWNATPLLGQQLIYATLEISLRASFLKKAFGS